MNVVDYIKKEALANGAERLGAYDELKRRSHALATLLLGGAGAMGAYGLGLLEKSPESAPAVPLLGSSLWCFLVAGQVVWCCLQARALHPLHNEPRILQDLLPEIHKAIGTADDAKVLVELRWREIGRIQGSIELLNKANAGMAAQLNRAYQFTVGAPVAALCAIPVWDWLRPFFA